MTQCKLSRALVATAVLVSTAFLPTLAQMAQSQSAAPLAASASTAVPALVPFSGVLAEANGKPVSSQTAVTFLVFKDQTGGEPLFAESQSITTDASGHYKVQLGASLANGLPADLFSTGEARWLEVQAAGQAPQPRVLMASVPYALKAADSATLGGLPASAFVLANSKAATDFAPAAVSSTTTAANVTTTGGTSGYLPEFSAPASIVDSPVFVSGANVGIGTIAPTATLDVNGSGLITGLLTANGGVNIGSALEMTPTGKATAAAGFNSEMLKFYTSAYNSVSAAVVNPRFEWEAMPTGNNTASPSATLNLFSSTTSASPTNTGFSFNANGTINFAKGQTFPGTGNGTIAGVTAGTGLTGGGTSGNVTLNVDTSKVPLLGATNNSFSGNESVGGNLSVSGGASVGGSLSVSNAVTATQIQSQTGSFTQGLNTSGVTLPATGTSSYTANYNSYPIDFKASQLDYFGGGVPGTADYRIQAEVQGTQGLSSSSLNFLFGYADGSGTPTLAETGVSIAANGTITAPRIITPKMTVQEPAGIVNTPVMVIQADEDGISRSGAQQLVIQGASIPAQQLLLGYISNPNTNSNGGLATIQATWNGVTNTALALQPNGGCVCVRTGLAGALGYQNNPFVVGQGQGNAVADGWATYSSRRFKTDIQTLPNALDKVEKLRGVSYTLKATGKHEIGVIAEEVGAVVPEVVAYEANGVDARSVDYNRLTALLIEATKQQQAEIASAMKAIRIQQATIRTQAASIASLKAQVRAGSESLHHVQQQLAAQQSYQPTQVAMR